MKQIRLFIAAFTMLLGLGAIAAPSMALAATPQSSACQALGSNSDCSKAPKGSVSVNRIVTVTINILSFAVGVTSVIMIIVGGFRYITSGGDSNNASSARNTILYAIIGLVIVAMAQFLVKFVLEKITK